MSSMSAKVRTRPVPLTKFAGCAPSAGPKRPRRPTQAGCQPGYHDASSDHLAGCRMQSGRVHAFTTINPRQDRRKPGCWVMICAAERYLAPRLNLSHGGEILDQVRIGDDEVKRFPSFNLLLYCRIELPPDRNCESCGGFDPSCRPPSWTDTRKSRHSFAGSAQRWSRFPRQRTKVDPKTRRTDHDEDAQPVQGEGRA